MSQDVVSFQSAGLRLHGVLSVPDGVKPGEKRAAFLVLHGFGSNSESSNCITPARVLNDFGYVTLRFDMRGCGKSEGEFGRIICLEQVEDTGNALEFLAKHPAVHPDRIGVIGSSFESRRGRASMRGGTNPRIAAVVSNGGWGHGERKSPRPASDVGGLGEVLEDAGRRPRLSRPHRKIADGAALRHRADPGSCAREPGTAESRNAGAKFR